MDKELMTSEVARQFNVHPDTIIRWGRIGKIPFKLNAYGWRFFKESDVQRLKRSLNNKHKNNHVGS